MLVKENVEEPPYMHTDTNLWEERLSKSLKRAGKKLKGIILTGGRALRLYSIEIKRGKALGQNNPLPESMGAIVKQDRASSKCKSLGFRTQTECRQ